MPLLAPLQIGSKLNAAGDGYNDMLSGAATRINTAALDLEFAERRSAASANKFFRQVTRNPFSAFKVMPR
jgi:hypothetical protein